MMFFIVRHGDPIYSTDTLTEQGFKQADALAPRFAVHGLDYIYCSPMGRAQDTARPTAKKLGIEPIIKGWASESLAWHDFIDVFDNGRVCWAYDSIPYAELHEMQFTDTPWYELPCVQNPEAAKHGMKTIADGVDELLAEHGYVKEGHLYRAEKPNDERIALFCHEGVGRFLMAYLMGLPVHYIWSNFGMSHATVTTFSFLNNGQKYVNPFCLGFSDLSHIYKEGTTPFRHYNRYDM